MRKTLAFVLLLVTALPLQALEQGYGYRPIAHFGEPGFGNKGTLDVELMSNEVKNCWGQKSRIGTLTTTGHGRPAHLTGCWRLDGDSVVMIIQDPISMETTMLNFPTAKFKTLPGFSGWSNP